MRAQRILWSLVSLIAISCECVFAQGGTSKPTAPFAIQGKVKPFLGRWDLTLKAPGREYPSWLEIYQGNGELKANMVGRWGNARPLPKVEITQGTLMFTSPKEEEDRKTDMVFKATLVQGRLVGSTTGPDGTPWTWTGKRAPSLIRTTSPQWGAPISLFNGKNMDGWYEYSSNDFPQSGHWKVVNGTLVSPGDGPELVSKKKFADFKLHLEWNCGPTSNSGVYLRGRYEVQIENESMDEPPSHHTGGVYGFLAPSPELPRTTGKWQSFDITLIGRKVTVVQDGKTIINEKEILGITGGALNSNEALPGPIMLQGSEKGHVSFRNIVVTPAVK
jgi:hypothetical protein